MSMIKVENLTFSYPTGGNVLFENVSFQIDTDWKLGFVGRNGRGKTTFLRLLQGEYEYSGKIISSVRFDYFPYPVKNKSDLTLDVLHEVCPSAEDWQLMRELSYLDADIGALYRPFDTLSYGEQTKVLLAALFLREGHFLLIDEPTNHLDQQAREAVLSYLQKKKGFILVSHDRNFLDGCVDHILSINRTDIELRSGNFSAFFSDFEKRQEAERAQNDRLKGEIKRLKNAANQTAAWSDRAEADKIGSGACDRGYIGHKAAKMMQQSKNIRHRQERAIEQKSALLRNTERAESLKMQPLAYHAERLVSLSGVAPVYGGKAVCVPVTFEIKRGDRIALLGKNGSGKSSLLKLLCGVQAGHTGEVRTGAGLIISCIPQDTSRLRGTLAGFAALNRIDESLFRAVLHKMGLEKAQADKDISEFSEGQKKKILLAKSLCERAHLYVWDEPLNFTDIYTRIQLEQLIDAFQPTMIFTEHDAAFRKKVATASVELHV